MKQSLIALFSGLLFATGLSISGMTLPSRVLGFLDIGGAWDASLALVMIGAIAVYASVYWVSRRLEQPLAADCFTAPASSRIDRRLLVGAALFGAGWGLAGYCPGPAIISTAAGLGQAALFSIAMFAGIYIAKLAVADRAQTFTRSLFGSYKG